MSRSRKVVSVLLAVVIVCLAGYWPLKSYLVDEYGELSFDGARDLMLIRLGLKEEYSEPEPMPAADVQAPAAIQTDQSIKPFREIGASLGQRAIDHNFNMMRGGTIFDANGDGRLDLFLPFAQRTYGKQTTKRGLLTEKKTPAKPNVLFLNQGNDENGDPILVAVQDLLVKGNRKLEREELMFEGKYQPRESLADDELAIGRIGWGAISADFNGDGRVDLYVMNGHLGIMIQTKEVGFPVYPAHRNLGREAKREPIRLQLFPFLRMPLIDGLHATVDYGTGSEREGRNTLYLNMGDTDGDGIPEWKDVTEETGVGGHWASVSATVSDYDRDGDLDLYVVNFYDPDFWGFGVDRFAGHRNQLYKNLLSETGEFKFSDVASDLKVAGMHIEEGLTSSVYFPDTGKHEHISEQYVEGKQVGEQADHSWSAGFWDWNRDGWADLVVANDVGNRLRVYENIEGREFRYLKEFNDQIWDGCWMGMSFGDLDGDMREEIMLTNCGSQAAAIRNTYLLVEDHKERSITALSHINYLAGRNTLHNEVIQYQGEKGFQRLGPQVKVRHSPYIAPDQTNPDNFAPAGLALFEKFNFADSFTGIEFAWHAPQFDVDNDGDLDIYMAGALTRGNDGIVGDWSGNPGRLLVNESRPGDYAFRDMTLEYRVLDVTDMDYEHNPPRRPAPGTGWHKRDYIYVTDMDSYSGMGLDATRSKTHDIFRMHEAAFGIVPGDLNGDGGQDFVVMHVAGFGYNSNSPTAKNLKVEVAGRVLAVPAPNKIGKAPTNFEPATTFVYINGGVPAGQTGNWVKVRLLDASGANVYAIGARVVANGRLLRWNDLGGSMAGGTHQDLHFGLGDEHLRELEIDWPSGEMQTQRITLEPAAVRETVCIDRRLGRVACGT